MKKFALLVLTVVFCSQYASAQYESTNWNEPLKGNMTYSIWTGKMRIGGTEIVKGTENLYLNESEMDKFSAANTWGNVGGTMIGFAIGYPIGYSLGGGTMTKEGKIACGVVGGLGLVVAVAANASVQKVVKSYNLRQSAGSGSMDLSFVAHPTGVGLVLSF